MSERIVTTIGSLDDIEGPERCISTFRARPEKKRRQRIISDDLDCMLGIGGLELGPEDTGAGGIVVPMLVPPQGRALAIPDKKKPSVSGNPKPAVPRKEAWVLGGGKYILQNGDTFFGLGTTYLGAGVRWPEIRSIQPDAWKKKNPSPDRIIAGDVILMPAEAQARARQLGVLPGVFGLSPMKVALAGLGVVVAGIGSYVFGSNS